jgi:hypothetical protein
MLSLDYLRNLKIRLWSLPGLRLAKASVKCAGFDRAGRLILLHSDANEAHALQVD